VQEGAKWLTRPFYGGEDQDALGGEDRDAEDEGESAS
jgi:hypothetical protein